MTFEEFLKQNNPPDSLRLVVKEPKDKNDQQVRFYIHPKDINGDTLDLKVEGNQLIIDTP